MLETDYNTLQAENVELDAEIKVSSQRRSSLLVSSKDLRKEINAGVKEYRKMEHDNTYFKGEIFKAENELRGTVKAVEDLDKKLKKLEESKESLNEEH
jgi:chromosome segregation ATPase